MSLDRKNKRTVSVTLQATKSELKALGEVLEEAEKRFNIDVSPSTQEVPGRIRLTDPDVTAWQYPRVSRVVKEMSEELRDETPGVRGVSFGDWTMRAENNDSQIVLLMNQVTRGKIKLGTSALINEDSVAELDSMVRSYSIGKRPHQAILADMDLEWVHVEPVVLHESVGSDRDRKLLNGYAPPTLSLKGFEKWMRKAGLNKAYVVVLKTKKDYPLGMPVRVDHYAWRKWVETRPNKDGLKYIKSRPPRTFEDLLEVLAVHVSSRAMDLSDAFIAPMKKVSGKVPVVGSLRTKILTAANVYAGKKGDVPDYANYYAFLVVGKGPTITSGLVNTEKPEDDFDMPNI